MRYRTFGRAGLEVSEIIFGGGWVGGVLIHQDDATKLSTLRRAMQASRARSSAQACAASDSCRR